VIVPEHCSTARLDQHQEEDLIGRRGHAEKCFFDEPDLGNNFRLLPLPMPPAEGAIGGIALQGVGDEERTEEFIDVQVKEGVLTTTNCGALC